MLLSCIAFVISASPILSSEIKPLEEGPYPVGSTNMEVASEFADIGDEAMHEYLLGRSAKTEPRRYVADLLKYPKSAWLIDVPIPDQSELYGPASGQTLPVVTYITFPSAAKQQRKPYAFPYHNAKYGIFQDMLSVGEIPSFADPNQRYPLIILAHGSSAHGIYDVEHAHNLASHGYIVAVIFYADDRTVNPEEQNDHLSFLRPLLTKAVLDSVLESESFGPHIDTDNIGISGHSFGGFTALAVAGGPFQGNTATVADKRFKAGVIAAPWVGGNYDGTDTFAFGPNNSDLNRVTIPILSFFGTEDQVTLASFILPAVKQLSGPTYLVELVDQPHIFEQGSWEDRDHWELLFFSAYLKGDVTSLATLKTGKSMQGGNQDIQRFDYQNMTGDD